MTRKEFLIHEAKKLLSKGINVIAVDGHKKAAFAWKCFSEDLIAETTLINQINSEKAEGIAIICGCVSGGLEVIDFDLKYDISGDLMERYNKSIPEYLLEKLHVVRTKSKGFHYYYRCEVVEGNKKLASRPATPEELKDTPHLKQLVLIETRGNNGYVVAPPSDGYAIVQPNEIPVITIEEREILLEAARSFHEIHVEERPKFTSTGAAFVVSPFDDYNQKTDAVALLCRHGWSVVSEDNNRVYLKRAGRTEAKTSGNYHKDKKLFYVWTSSTEFYPEKAYSPAAIYSVLNHSGDYSAASKQLIKDGYGTRSTPESVRKVLETPFEHDFKFWRVNDKEKIEINVVLLIRFINEKGGFTIYKYNEDSEAVIVRVIDGMVKRADVGDIKKFVQLEIEDLPDTFDSITKEELLNVVIKQYDVYLSKNFMSYLKIVPLDFLKDTPDAAFFPFRNGIVEVTADGCKLHKYGSFDKVIWAAQMIDRDVTLYGNDYNIKPDFDNITFYKFIQRIAGNDPDKIVYFISVLGYLLHKNKDPKRPFAVILAEETENDANGGGTGKGLFVRGVSELIPTETFDGKQFDTGKSFAFQRISLGTKLMNIDDARRGFNFENLNTLITGDIIVEKKNQGEYKIAFADSPKIIISTNYSISDESNHAKRRQRVLEFSSFFSPSHTPFDEFGVMLFDEWDADEWNRFYNFMFFSCRAFLADGILSSVQSDTNKYKNIKDRYSEDFLLFFNELANLNRGFVPLKDLYSEFVNMYGVDVKKYDKRKFGAGVRYAGQVLGYFVDEKNQRISAVVHKVVRVRKTLEETPPPPPELGTF
jgi:hypothetical protein